MWRPRFESICRSHPDLVAVFESPASGVLAILLRSTVVPLPEEHEQWIDETRRAARAIIGRLRAAGLRREVVILQWRSPEEIAYVLRAWVCRCEVDPDRLAELSAVVVRLLEDHRYLSSRRAGATAAGPAAQRDLDVVLRSCDRHGLSDWYRHMAPCWLRIEPALRRQLVLRVHRWIVERVLIPLARGDRADVDDLVAGASLGPDGSLAGALEQSIPPVDVEAWRPWIRLVVAALRRALAEPDEKRTATWARWLFFIPLSIPTAGASRPPHGDRRGGSTIRRARVALLAFATLAVALGGRA
jgi:hypothetical protein